VGTAYRQRAQLLIFYFMFVAVGYVLLQERREARAAQQLAARQAAQDEAAAQRRYERWRRNKEHELEKLADDLRKSLGF
jgi:Flp pilus assembly protein TadB